MRHHVEGEDHVPRIELDSLFGFALEKYSLPQLSSGLDLHLQVPGLNSYFSSLADITDSTVGFDLSFSLTFAALNR